MTVGHYSDFHEEASATPATARGDYAGRIFLWAAWILAAAFWAIAAASPISIVSALLTHPPAGEPGGADAGGIGFLLMDVVGGMVILGLVLAFGAWRWASRDKRLDPMTEAATRQEYADIARGREPADTRLNR
jgi:hypothetical protein